MTEIDLNDLREKAEAATPGPWSSSGSQVWGHDGNLVAAVRDHSELVDRPDAEFIAAANPATVLALIERLKTAEHERDELRAERDDCCCDKNPETTDGPSETCPRHGRHYSEWVEWGTALANAVERVRPLHRDDGDGYCWSDDEQWPCSTIRALDGEES